LPNGNNPYQTLEESFYLLEPYLSTLPFGGYLDHYTYQGISPDIMNALTNVFDIGSGVSLDALFGDQIPGLTSTLASGAEGIPVGLWTSIENLPEGWDMAYPEGYLQLEDLQSLANELGIDTSGTQEEDWGEFMSAFMGDDTWYAADWQESGYIPSAIEFTDIFDPESIASALSAIGGISDSITGGEIRALTPEMLQKTEKAYYDPYEERGRKELVDKLGKGLAKATTGGFAGSGVREKGLSGAEELYRGGYEDLLKDIMGFQAGATEDVLDTIYSWQELLSEQ